MTNIHGRIAGLRGFAYLTVSATILYLAPGSVQTAQAADTPAQTAPTHEDVELAYPEVPVTVDDPTPLEILHEQIRVCANMAGRVPRLLCYDGIANERGIKTAQQQIENTNVLNRFGFWEVSVRRDELMQETVILKIDSVNPVRDRYGGDRIPSFIIRCLNRETTAYLDWKSPVNRVTQQRDIIVEHSFGTDSPTPVTGRWDLSLDSYAAFVPRPIEFVRELQNHTRMMLRVTPTGETVASVVFDTTGIDQALEVLVQRCYAP